MHAQSPRHRSPLVLWLTKALSVAFFLAVAAMPAAANPKYAGLVVDVISGKDLYADSADEMRYPASLTKIMTLYVVFEELAAGRITLDTNFTMSEYAASRPPSKIGIRPGGTMAVRDAIKALVTKSANDVAAMTAENISGSVSAFTARMTKTAHRLGMANTTFTTPSGLPDPGNKTTARDMVTLGIAIQRDFPQYYGVFSTRVFEYGKRRYGNHNRLLGRVEGVDGIKTGYINASGFNLVTSVRRDGRHLVAVVMGGTSGAARDKHMADLIARTLPKAKRGEPMVFAAWSDFGPPPIPVARPTLAVRFAARIEKRDAPEGDPLQTILAFASQTREAAGITAPANATDALHAVIASAGEAAAPSAEPLPSPVSIPSPRSVEAALESGNARAGGTAGNTIELASADPDAVTRTLSERGEAPVSRFGAVFGVFATGTTAANDNALSAFVEERMVPVSGLTVIAMGSAPVTTGKRAPRDPSSAKHTMRLALAAVESAAAAAKAPAADAKAAAPAESGWQIQVGAVKSESAAAAILDEAARTVPAMGQQTRVTVTATTANGTIYRARFGGFRSEADAIAACKLFTNHNRPCWAVSM